MLDNVQKLETPEGTLISLSPAGPLPRAAALVVDTIIQVIIFYALSIPAVFLGKYSSGIIQILAFLDFWFYHTLFEMLMRGQTPGKRMMNLRVIRENGSPITWEASILRNFIRMVDMLPGSYLFGLVSLFFTQHFQRIGDLVAATLVVHCDKPSQPPGELMTQVPQPLSMSLTLQEQRALISFAEKQKDMHQGYFIELADLLQPLTGQKGRAGAEILVANAQWLRGRRG